MYRKREKINEQLRWIKTVSDSIESVNTNLANDDFLYERDDNFEEFMRSTCDTRARRSHTQARNLMVFALPSR